MPRLMQHGREGRRPGLPALQLVGLLLLATTAAGAADDASFVSYVDVPTTMKPGDKATVTVTMKNTGTTTWTSGVSRSGGTIYWLGAANGTDWGQGLVALSGAVARNATHSFTFEITAPSKAMNYAFRWRMRDRLTT